MKRPVWLLIGITVLAGSAVSQVDPVDSVLLGNTRILLPAPPVADGDETEITVQGTLREPGYAATLLAVHNLRGRITFEIEVRPVGENQTGIEFEEWSVSARLGYLSEGIYDVVAVVNGKTVAEKRLEISDREPGPDPDAITWIEYRKSGGIAGIDRQLHVDLETREYELTSDGEFYEGTLSLQNYLRLVSAVLLCDFANLEPEYKPETPVADGFTYEIEVPGYEIIGYSGAEIPKGFSFLVGTLDNLVGQILQSEAPRPTPTPIPPTTIDRVDYRKSGGNAGIDRRFSVDLESYEYTLEADGEHFEGVLNPTSALRVEFAVIMTDFENLEAEYRPETPADDGYTYIIEVPGKRVVGYTGAEVPRGLSFLVKTLDEAVEDLLAVPPLPTPAPPTPTDTPIGVPTPTATSTPTSTPTPGDVLFVTGKLTVFSDTPSEFRTIRAAVDLSTPPDVFRVVSQTVASPEDGLLQIDLTVAPVWPAPSDARKGGSIRTFLDLGELAPGEYEAVLSVNDIETDRRVFRVDEPSAPFLQFTIAGRGGTDAVHLEISQEGRFILSRGDSMSNANSMRGRLFPDELEELETLMDDLPFEPLPQEGPPALEPGDTVIIHEDQMLVIESGKFPPPEALGGVARLGRLANELVVRSERAAPQDPQLLLLPERGQRVDSVTFDLSGEFPASNYAVVWADLETTEGGTLDLYLWTEITAPMGAQVITPWRVQVPATDLDAGEYEVRLILNGKEADRTTFAVGRGGPRR